MFFNFIYRCYNPEAKCQKDRYLVRMNESLESVKTLNKCIITKLRTSTPVNTIYRIGMYADIDWHGSIGNQLWCCLTLFATNFTFSIIGTPGTDGLQLLALELYRSNEVTEVKYNSIFIIHQ